MTEEIIKKFTFPKIEVIKDHEDPVRCTIPHCNKTSYKNEPYYVLTRRDGKQVASCKHCAAKYAVKEGMFDSFLGEEVEPESRKKRLEIKREAFSGMYIKMELEYYVPMGQIKESRIDDFSDGSIKGLRLINTSIVREEDIKEQLNEVEEGE